MTISNRRISFRTYVRDYQTGRAVVGVGFVGLAALVDSLSGSLRIPSRVGLVMAAACAVFAPLLPMTPAVQIVAPTAVLALLLVEARDEPNRGTGQLNQAA